MLSQITPSPSTSQTQLVHSAAHFDQPACTAETASVFVGRVALKLVPVFQVYTGWVTYVLGYLRYASQT